LQDFLAQAEYSRRIAVAEAQAKKDSAKLLAEAEVERAQGVAKANKIIGDSLKGNEAYLRYLWIDGLKESSKQGEVIYVPTEAGLPILEAGRLH
jgi:regulator of protease activity HflC (stomatin/prohibitin superfamily)